MFIFLLRRIEKIRANKSKWEYKPWTCCQIEKWRTEVNKNKLHFQKSITFKFYVLLSVDNGNIFETTSINQSSCECPSSLLGSVSVLGSISTRDSGLWHYTEHMVEVIQLVCN